MACTYIFDHQSPQAVADKNERTLLLYDGIDLAPAMSIEHRLNP